MWDLGTLANLAEIIGASTIVTGLDFGLIQLRHYREQQRDAIARGLSETFYKRDLAVAIARIQRLPDRIGLEELRAEQQQPSWGEWFTWLAAQVDRLKSTQPPAHLAHRDWRA